MGLNAILQKSNIFLYLTGLIITIAEVILHFSDKSLCPTQGCRIVESFVKGGEIILLLVGVVIFLILLLLSVIKKYELIHSMILISALSVEGYLLGFQLFFLREFCLFCIVVFGILSIASFLRLIQGKREIALGFLCFVSVFFISYLVSPQIKDFPTSKYVLVYSKDCPKCKEILQYCKEMSIPVDLLEASEVINTLKALKISSVPILFCNETNEKRFIIGAEKIKEYLVAKALPKEESIGVCPIFTPSDCK